MFQLGFLVAWVYVTRGCQRVLCWLPTCAVLAVLAVPR